MRISIVTGFFLPVPATRGGATERSWEGLAGLFAAAGHQVTFVSRRLPGSPAREQIGGVQHVRVAGFDHTRSLARNLLLDARWGWRVSRVLPPGDIVICNTITLPAWLASSRPECGKVTVMIGRTPRSQVWFYGQVERIYVPSAAIRDQIRSARAARKTLPIGYPIDWQLHADQAAQPGVPLTIGFIGRLHPEKGVGLLIQAALLLRSMPGLGSWRLRFLGPTAVAEGGGGPEWLDQQRRTAAPLGDQVEWHEPEFEPAALARAYGQLDVFAYPSLAARGETFGVAIAEAMAARCAVVVSSLGCFRELVQDGQTGLVFNHEDPQAARRLAESLHRLLANAPLRDSLSRRGQAAVRRFDFAEMAEKVLADLTVLTGETAKKSQ